jgi:ATP/ADP translocase
MSDVVITIIVTVLFVVAQSVVSKFESWAWGLIIPTIIILFAVFVFFFTELNFGYKNFLVFAVPFGWSLDIWDKGRKKLKEQKERELEFMKAKDLE